MGAVALVFTVAANTNSTKSRLRNTSHLHTYRHDATWVKKRHRVLWLLSLPHELFSGRYWVKLVKFAVVHGHSRHRVETTLTRTVAVLARQVALALAFLKAHLDICTKIHLNTQTHPEQSTICSKHILLYAKKSNNGKRKSLNAQMHTVTINSKALSKAHIRDTH